METLNALRRDNAEKVLRNGDSKYKVVMEDGSIFTVTDDSCSCGHERDFQPSRSAGLEQSYRNRRDASCSHQVAVLNSKNLGACSECGEYQVREQKLNHMGRHVDSDYICTGCGKTHYE